MQILRIGRDCANFSFYHTEYLNADRWEQLISRHLPNLTVFDFQRHYCVWDCCDNREIYETQLDKLQSLFWMKRQWFFEYQYYRTATTNNIIIYSTNPYR